MKFTRAVPMCLCLLSAVALLAQTRAADDPALTAYKKTVYQAIGEPWNKMVKRESDLVTIGRLHVAFSILPDGHVENLRSLGNTSSQYFEMATLRVIEHAHIPPIPSAVLKTLPGHRLEMDITFDKMNP